MARTFFTVFAGLFLMAMFAGCGEMNNMGRAAELQKKIITLEAELKIRQQENQLIKEQYDKVMAKANSVEKEIKNIKKAAINTEQADQQIKELEKAVEEEKAKASANSDNAR